MNLADCFLIASKVSGDYAEIGVYRGATFFRMLKAAAMAGRRCHAVDSFAGMAEPTGGDGPVGAREYPAGKFDQDGPAAFTAELEKQSGCASAVIHCGWVPEVLETIGCSQFALVVVDLDHYAPTLASLNWAWPKIVPGGLLVMHDWFPSKTTLASKAAVEFAGSVGIPPTEIDEHYAVWCKPRGN